MTYKYQQLIGGAWQRRFEWRHLGCTESSQRRSGSDRAFRQRRRIARRPLMRPRKRFPHGPEKRPMNARPR